MQKQEYNKIKSFFLNEKGLENIEYAIIIGLITVGLIVTLTSIGTILKDRLNTLVKRLQGLE